MRMQLGFDKKDLSFELFGLGFEVLGLCFEVFGLGFEDLNHGVSWSVLGSGVLVLFRREAAVDPAGGGIKTARPNHPKLRMWLGFDKKQYFSSFLGLGFEVLGL